MSCLSLFALLQEIQILAFYKKFTLLTLLSPTLTAFADPIPPDPSASTLDPVIITATRTPQTVDDTLSPVTVISRADIEQSQAQSLFDLLRGQIGINVSSVGGPGAPVSVFMRGTNSDHVLVLIDGVKVGSATTGEAALQDLPLELIDHIEIVRGPRSSLYGSEAIGGVIQIFTKKGTDTFTPTLSTGFGSFGTSQIASTLSGTYLNSGWYSAGFSGFDTSGIPACRGNQTSTGCPTLTNSTVNDGYHNQSGRLRTGWTFDDGTTAEVDWMHTIGASQYIGTYSDQSQTSQNILSADLSTHITNYWQSNLRISQSQDNLNDFLDGIYIDTFNTARDLTTWQNNFNLSTNQTLVAGFDQQNDIINGSTPYGINSRTNTGLFLQYLGQMGAQDLELSARRDINQQFGTATTGSAAWGYALTPTLKFSSSYGSAFKAPTFNQLYYPFYGNPTLQPERSKSLDIGLTDTQETQHWSIHGFETRLTDMIDTGPLFTAINIDSAIIRGIETVYGTQFRQWTIQANLDILDPTNRTPGQYYGALLPQRAPASASLALDRNWNLWSFGTTVRAESARNDFAYLAPNYNQQIVHMGSFTTLDLRTEYKISHTWRVQGMIQNLFNKDYMTAYPYNQLGRGYYVTFRYQP